MPEYIERERLLLEIENDRHLNWTNSEAENQADLDFDCFIETIKAQPIADVAEVKHGEWKLDVYSFYVDTYSEESELGVYIYATCSNCGKPHQTNGYSGQVFSKTVYAPEGQERGYKFDQNYEEFKAIEEFRKRNYKFTNYCPNCGAKMDKE